MSPPGAPRWFHTIKTPLIERDGSCNRVLGLSTDITAQRHAEVELRRANDELRALFEASPLAICGLTADGYVRTWNRAAEELFGWDAGEVIGRPLPIVPPELEEQHRELRDTVLAGKPAVNVETFRMRKDGERIDVTISTAALHDAQRRHQRRGGGLRRHARAQGARGAAPPGAEDGGGRASSPAASRTTSTTCSRSSRLRRELLLADLDAEDPRRCDVEEIEEAGDRARASLTRQLLAFSRQQVLRAARGRSQPRSSPSMEPMLRRLLGEENIAVVTAPGRRASAACSADRSQLEQVCSTSWSTRATPCPTAARSLIETANVELDAACPAHPASTRPYVAADGDRHRLRHGRRPRRRGSSSRSSPPRPSGKGTGLGLATVYGIVKQSGGHIWVVQRGGPRDRPSRSTLPRADAPPMHRGAGGTQRRCRAGDRRGCVGDASSWSRTTPRCGAPSAACWSAAGTSVVASRNGARRARDARRRRDRDGRSGDLGHRHAGDERSRAAGRLKELRPTRAGAPHVGLLRGGHHPAGQSRISRAADREAVHGRRIC